MIDPSVIDTILSAVVSSVATGAISSFVTLKLMEQSIATLQKHIDKLAAQIDEMRHDFYAPIVRRGKFDDRGG